jgi:predicted nucleic-acid-binding Zn-ribbon protein
MNTVEACVRCGSNDLTFKKIDVQLNGGNNSAKVFVKTEVCLNCGERFYSPENLKYFSNIKKALKEGNARSMGLKKVGIFYELSKIA